jgi:hypothetical protein
MDMRKIEKETSSTQNSIEVKSETNATPRGIHHSYVFWFPLGLIFGLASLVLFLQLFYPWLETRKHKHHISGLEQNLAESNGINEGIKKEIIRINEILSSDDPCELLLKENEKIL